MFSPGVDQGPAALDDRHFSARRGRVGVPYGAEDITIDLRHEDESAADKLRAVTRLRDPDLAAALDHVYLGARLHDIGKLGVAEAILWKPAGLTSTEWREVRTHPEEGHRLVADVVHRDVASAVLYHHERMDGDGYPFGIDARSLPIVVRIVQVADAFDAMTSNRPYQRALHSGIAVEEIARCAGSQFDPDVAGAIARVFGDERPPVIVDDERAEEPMVAEKESESDPFGAAGFLRLTDRPA
jgi:HD-GYP domain-containing protein (c-di-GMP phosphodiesterase class II)